MFNKILLVSSLFLSGFVYSSTNAKYPSSQSYTTVNNEIVGQINKVVDVRTGHMYYVKNSTAKEQIYHICYQTNVCENGDLNFRQLSYCDPTFILKTNQVKQSNYNQDLKSIYYNVGNCQVKTYTFIHGIDAESSSANGILKIVN